MSTEIRYPKRRAASLIAACYAHFGAKINIDAYVNSPLEEELGRIPASDREGLFRYLDEAIYLIHIVFLHSMADISFENCRRSIPNVLFAMRQTAASIRCLEAVGLDAPARQNLRVLYEQALVACRLVVDEEFRIEFDKGATLEAANGFWHRYISRGKTEKYLKEYCARNDRFCAIYMGKDSEEFTKILGVAGHPTSLSFLFDFQEYFLKAIPAGGYGNADKMLELSVDKSSDFVLAHTIGIALSALCFCIPEISRASVSLNFLKDNPLFIGAENDGERMVRVEKVCALMMLMLFKLTNLVRIDFDPELHF